MTLVAALGSRMPCGQWVRKWLLLWTVHINGGDSLKFHPNNVLTFLVVLLGYIGYILGTKNLYFFFKFFWHNKKSLCRCAMPLRNTIKIIQNPRLQTTTAQLEEYYGTYAVYETLLSLPQLLFSFHIPFKRQVDRKF